MDGDHSSTCESNDSRCGIRILCPFKYRIISYYSNLDIYMSASYRSLNISILAEGLKSYPQHRSLHQASELFQKTGKNPL